MKLFYYPGNASMTPHFILEEIGQPFELALVDRNQAQHKSAAYLKLNPNGLIPVLVDDTTVLYETAAISLYLAEKYPQKELLPALGTPQRAQFYTLLMWLGNTLQATLLPYFYPERWVDAGNGAGAAQVKAAAEARVSALLDQLDQQLLASGGPWLLGEQYTVLDPYALMLCRWTRGFSRPAREHQPLGEFLSRVLARPAIQRVLATEGLAAPWV